MAMVVTREDKFGCIGDACGATGSLRLSQIPRSCVNAVCEGARDARRNGVGAWARNERYLYLGLLVAAAAALVGLLRLCVCRGAQPREFRGAQPLDEYVLVRARPLLTPPRPTK